MEISSTTQTPIETTPQVTNNTTVNTVLPDAAAVPGSSQVSNDFSAFILKSLGKSASSDVNEEELFAAIIQKRLASSSEEASNYFSEQKTELMSTMARADGYVSVEDVANKALERTVNAGKIDAKSADDIKSVAFRGAQLDDNLSALYDGRGSANDPTVAVSQMEAALLGAKSILDKIDSGEIDATTPPTESPDGNSDSGSLSGSQGLDGEGGFLWKPTSESDGNLVVLLPTDLKGFINKVEIHSELPPTEASKLAEGRFSGDTHNGGRAHFRFDQPGSEYGDNINLVVFKDNGETVSWNISNGGDRND